MKKSIVLLICVISSITIHAMENSSWLDNYNSLFSEFVSKSEKESKAQISKESKAQISKESKPQIPKESSFVIELRKNVNEFENVLQFFSREEPGIKKILLAVLLMEKEAKTKDLSIAFLQCCYNYKYWEKDGKRINKLGTDLIDLKKYHHSERKGFSALGAAMIAQDLSFEKRRLLTQELGTYGFKPTSNDINLAELILYDQIKGQGKQKMFFNLLYPCPNIGWSVLPHEIRKYIAYYLRDLFKNEFWLLPQ